MLLRRGGLPAARKLTCFASGHGDAGSQLHTFYPTRRGSPGSHRGRAADRCGRFRDSQGRCPSGRRLRVLPVLADRKCPRGRSNERLCPSRANTAGRGRDRGGIGRHVGGSWAARRARAPRRGPRVDHSVDAGSPLGFGPGGGRTRQLWSSRVTLGGVRRRPLLCAVAVVAIASAAACSGGHSKPSAAFCSTAKSIRQENANVSAAPAQQRSLAISEAQRLAAVSLPAVRSALLTLAAALQPLAAGEAVGMTPPVVAVQAQRQRVAAGTVDQALRQDCGLDISVLGQTQSSTAGTSQ